MNSNLTIPLFDQDFSLEEKEQLGYYLNFDTLKKYFFSLPQPVQEVIRRVLLVNGILEISDSIRLFELQNLLSENLVRKLSSHWFPWEKYSWEVEKAIIEAKQQINWRFNFLEERKSSWPSKNTAYIYGSWKSAFLMSSWDPILYFLDDKYTDLWKLIEIFERYWWIKPYSQKKFVPKW